MMYLCRTFTAAILAGLLLPAASIPVVAVESETKTAPTQDLTFDDIKFEMKKEDPFERSLLTPKIEALEGMPIKIRGFMLPHVQSKGIKQFVLVRDNQECCFGPGAALYDCIIVDMVEGQTAKYKYSPIAVEGVFKVHEMKDADGKHLAIYHLDAKSVK